MYRVRFTTKRYITSRNDVVTDTIDLPCENIGTKIANQMYSGVDQSNSTLLTGQFDPEESMDVDPACDFATDRFGLTIVDPVPTGDSTPTVDSTPTD